MLSHLRGHLFIWQNNVKLGSLNESCVNFYCWEICEFSESIGNGRTWPLRFFLLFMENMRWQLETIEVASLLLYICSCFSISVRFRNLIEFLGLIDNINPLSSLLIISMRKVVNLVLFYLISIPLFTLLTFA